MSGGLREDHPRRGPHVECQVDHDGRGVPRHCRCGAEWPCPLCSTACAQCGVRVYRTPSGHGWTDRADGTDTLGSGEVCLAGPSLTHKVARGE